MEYDPNMQWKKQTVEMTFAQWDYTATATVAVFGNCKGMDILTDAIHSYDCELYAEYRENAKITLTRPSKEGGEEDSLECTPDGDATSRWLEQMCIGLRIISVEDVK